MTDPTFYVTMASAGLAGLGITSEPRRSITLAPLLRRDSLGRHASQ